MLTLRSVEPSPSDIRTFGLQDNIQYVLTFPTKAFLFEELDYLFFDLIVYTPPGEVFVRTYFTFLMNLLSWQKTSQRREEKCFAFQSIKVWS